MPPTGVQFIFGGASQMVANTNGATVELCPDPTPANSPQQMTIFGQKTGSPPPTNDGARDADRRHPIRARGRDLPTNVLPFSIGASTIDSTRYASRALRSNKSTSLVLSGYTGAAGTVPGGSINVSYTLKVAHQETNTSDPTTSAALAASITGCTRARVDQAHDHELDGGRPSDRHGCADRRHVHRGVAERRSVSRSRVHGPVKETFTENLDGIDLVVTYTPPAVRAENGCTIVLNSCSVLTSEERRSSCRGARCTRPSAASLVNVTDEHCRGELPERRDRALDLDPEPARTELDRLLLPRGGITVHGFDAARRGCASTS